MEGVIERLEKCPSEVIYFLFKPYEVLATFKLKKVVELQGLKVVSIAYHIWLRDCQRTEHLCSHQ